MNAHNLELDTRRTLFDRRLLFFFTLLSSRRRLLLVTSLVVVRVTRRLASALIDYLPSSLRTRLGRLAGTLAVALRADTFCAELALQVAPRPRAELALPAAAALAVGLARPRVLRGACQLQTGVPRIGQADQALRLAAFELQLFHLQLNLMRLELFQLGVLLDDADLVAEHLAHLGGDEVGQHFRRRLLLRAHRVQGRLLQAERVELVLGLRIHLHDCVALVLGAAWRRPTRQRGHALDLLRQQVLQGHRLQVGLVVLISGLCEC